MSWASEDAGTAFPYDVVRFRPERNGTLDTLRWAKKRHGVPLLVEVDVTPARDAIRALGTEPGQRLSFTAWVIHCVARAAAEHPRVHSVRRGRRRLVVFREVDVAVLVERPLGEETLPMPFVVRNADAKSARMIHDEVRAAQAAVVPEGAGAVNAGPAPWVQALFFRLPTWSRDLLYWRWLMRSPSRIQRTMGTVVVTATGMAAPGVLAWGVPVSIHPLAVGIGGIARRSTDTGPAEVLALSIVFDHAVTDGAAVGRFVARLCELMTTGHGLPTGPGVTVGQASPDRVVQAFHGDDRQVTDGPPS